MNHEDAFLQAILADPNDDAPRLLFADWLDEGGDPRGEFLRIDTILRKLSQADARCHALRVRMAALRAGIQSEWLASVDRTSIENCRGRRPLSLRFQCPRRWEALKPGDEPAVRF